MARHYISMEEIEAELLHFEHRPLVTVVTPTYNLVKSGRADSFRQTVESVHAQTYENIEHLVIDGASSDGTPDLIREYEQKGWLTVYSEPDKGIYDAFNKGLHKAKGKYIAYLNSDDWWHDARGVEYSVCMLEKSGVAFSFAPCRELKENGCLAPGHDTPISCFYRQMPMCHQTMFCRTDVLRETGGFDLSYKIVSDYHAVMQIVLKGYDCVRIPLCFTTFRWGGCCADMERLLQESDDVQRQLFSTCLTEEDMDKIRRCYIPPLLKEELATRIHPSIFSEMEQRSLWDNNEKAWRYKYGRISWGPLGLAQVIWLSSLKRHLVSACSYLARLRGHCRMAGK